MDSISNPLFSNNQSNVIEFVFDFQITAISTD